jgi:hypothetical protein
LSAVYRKDYEICYQWSPIDKMSQCTLKAGTKVVIGTGQSAKCSGYLIDEVSAKKQVFIDNADEAIGPCKTFDASFDWTPIDAVAQ